MLKSLVLALGLTVSLSASANTIENFVRDMNHAVFAEAKSPFNWVVGDTATYNAKISFISGKMIMTVKSVTATQVVINQNIDMLIIKQDCDSTINSSTGQVESIVCNGQAQDPNQGGDIEVIESKEDTVKVPAGTFTCLYIKAKTTVQGNASEIQQWVNPKQVPVMGLVKMMSAVQGQNLVMELASFKKM